MKGLFPFLIFASISFMPKASALVNGTTISASQINNTLGSSSVLAVYGDNNFACMAVMVNSTNFLIPYGKCGGPSTLWVTNDNFLTFKIYNVVQITTTPTSGLSVATISPAVDFGTEIIRPATITPSPTWYFPPYGGVKCKVYGVDLINGNQVSLTSLDVTVISNSACVTAWGRGQVNTDGTQFCAYVTQNGQPTSTNAIRAPAINTLGDYPAPIFCENWGFLIWVGVNLQIVELGIGLIPQSNKTSFFAGFMDKTNYAGNSVVLPTVFRYAYDIKAKPN